MSPLLHHQVFQSMASSPNARLERCTELGDGLAAAQWSNHHDARDYEGPSHHTLSCYLAGGTGTFRRERPDTKGAPGKLCIMPAGHDSSWVVNGEIRLAHLYIPPEQFAHAAVTLLDREPRELEMREATFLDDPEQVLRFQRLVQLDWHEPGSACSPPASPTRCSTTPCSPRWGCARARSSRAASPRPCASG